MRTRRTAGVALAIGLAVLLVATGAAALDADLFVDGYERTTVTVVDGSGTTLATVDARVADTPTKRYVGLSDTETLSRGEGMLFVHDREDTHAYVMRDMDFPLDIVFVGADGTVTTVHHAPVPSEVDGDDRRRYEGRAKYVLEVPRGYANETGISVGDRVRIADDP